MLDARFRPLPKWMRKPDLGWERPRFRTAYNKALDALEYELDKLYARDVFIEAGFQLGQLRNDGWPRGGQKPTHPGIVLYFTTQDGAMEFPCGTYENFEANLYAIALTLENLRAIDRYGVTLGHQQYRGFMAIEAAPKQLTVEQAVEFVALASGLPSRDVFSSAEAYRGAYRAAARRLHPDVAGTPDGFHKLNQAKEVLDRHHGLGTANARPDEATANAGGNSR
jgi:hypothetical protein